MTTIEILHSPGCGNTQTTIPIVDKLVAEAFPGAVVVIRDISEQPEAARRFAGSPTVLIDGVDIELGVEPDPGAG